METELIPNESPPAYGDVIPSTALPEPEQSTSSSLQPTGTSEHVQHDVQRSPAGSSSPPGQGTPHVMPVAPPPYTYHPQQQQQVVVVGGAQQRPVVIQQVQSYVGHIVFAVLVLIFCNPIFGFVALILAAVASSVEVQDPPRARRLGGASLALSISGVVVSAAGVIILIAVLSTRPSCSHYSYLGTCYSYRTYVGSSGSCYGGEKSYVDGYCYYDQCPDYEYLDSCYNYKTYVGYFDTCSGLKSPDDYCYSTYCPYHVYQGSCYKYRSSVDSSGSCYDAVKTSSSYCYYNTCPYTEYQGTCYKYKTYVGFSGACSGLKSSSNYCYSNSCPTNLSYRASCYKYRMYVGTGACKTGGTKSGINDYCYYASCPDYEYRGSCYKYRTDVARFFDSCSGILSSGGLYCYYGRYDGGSSSTGLT